MYHTHDTRLTPAHALDLCTAYDLILDCTDQPSSRYFISDAAVLTGKPLISASALRTEGQLLVLNYPPRSPHIDSQSPCYRCVFPRSPPPESMTTCGEGGILGPVVGVVGAIMAMEALKIITSYTPKRSEPKEHFLLLYSAYPNPMFRNVRLKGKKQHCVSCSDHPTITRTAILSGSINYMEFCGIRSNTNVLPDHERISAMEYATLRQARNKPHFLIDVREAAEFEIASIKDSINMPFSSIQGDATCLVDLLGDQMKKAKVPHNESPQVYFVCKLGNDSQVAAAKLKEVLQLSQHHPDYILKGDIRGGLWQWREQVDKTFPDYGGFPETL